MEAIIGIGANSGCREAAIERSCRLMEQRIGQVLLSPVYETRPLLHPTSPSPGQPNFLNAVAVVECGMDAAKLLAELLDIERSLGRTRDGDSLPWAQREIDLDLLAYGDEVIVGDGLVVPHPRMHTRDFVLRPLSDVRPHWEHPVTGRDVNSMLAEADQNILNRFQDSMNCAVSAAL